MEAEKEISTNLNPPPQPILPPAYPLYPYYPCQPYFPPKYTHYPFPAQTQPPPYINQPYASGPQHSVHHSDQLPHTSVAALPQNQQRANGTQPTTSRHTSGQEVHAQSLTHQIPTAQTAAQPEPTTNFTPHWNVPVNRAQ